MIWVGAAWLLWVTFGEGEPVSYRAASQALSFVLVLLAMLASYERAAAADAARQARPATWSDVTEYE